MSFSNEIKTILKLDDKDWKKALSSISAAEKSYVKESKQNTEDLIRTKQSLSDLEQQKAKEIAIINAKIATSEANKTKALENGDKALISSVNKRLSLYKQQRREIEANSKIEIEASKQSIRQVSNTISTQNQYATLLKKAKAAHQEIIPSIDKHNTSMSNLANTTIRYLRWAGTIAGVVYTAKRAWDLTLGAGLDVNKMMEDNASGIAALLTANTSMILSNGMVVDSYEKFRLGGLKATKIMDNLRIASVKTFATYPQLTGIYQQMIGHTLSFGKSFGTTVDEISQNTIELGKILSNIGGSIGMEMQKVNEEARSLISGTASTDSLISMMVFGSPTQANEAIKAAKARGTNGLKDMLFGILESYKVLEGVKTYTKAQLDLQDALMTTRQTLSEPMFNELKGVFSDMAIELRANEKMFTEWGKNIVASAKFVIDIADEVLIAILGWKVGFPAIKMLAELTTVASASMVNLGRNASVATLKAEALTIASTTLGRSIKALAVAGGPMLLAIAAYETYNWLLGDSAKKEETLLGLLSKKTDDLNAASTAQLEYNKALLEEGLTKKRAAEWEAKFQLSQAKSRDNRPDSELSKEQLTERKRLELSAQLASQEYEQTKTQLAETGKVLNTRIEILAKLKETKQAQESLGELTVKLTRSAKIEGDVKTFIKKEETELVKLGKQKAEWNQELLKSEKDLVELRAKYSDKNTLKFEDIEEVKKQQEYIQSLKTGILDTDKAIAEENTKIATKTEAVSNTIVKDTIKLSEQAAIRTEINALLAGTYNTETYALDMSRIKVEAAIEEYEIIDSKLSAEKDIYKQKLYQIELEKDYRDILVNQLEYEEKITKLNEKQQSFKNIKNFVKYNGDQSTLDQIYAELQINYKDDQESLSSLQTWFDKQQSILDKKDLMVNIKFNGFDEVSTGFATLANSYQDIGKAEKDYQKILKDKNASEVDRQQAVIDYRDTTITSYANMTGAVASFYNEDDDRREKQLELQKVMNAAKMAMQFAEMAQSTAFTTLFVAQEAVKSSAAGVTAVATAAASSPWTGFITAAAMAAMLASFGVMFTSSGTKTSTSSDAFSAQAENTGTGSILGDMSAQSESMQNSLSILEDYKKPEFKVLSSMNTYLENISNSIGGVTSLLIQQGGFSFGAGAKEYDTGFKNNIDINSGIMGAINPLAITDKIMSVIGLDFLSGVGSGIVNSVLGGLFGKTSVSQSLKDSGIYFADTLLKSAIDEFNGKAYQTIATTVKEKSWLGSSSSTSIARYFQALDSETERQFSLVLGNLYDTVLLAGDALDANANTLANQLDNFVVSIGKISLKGKTGDQIQEQLTAVFGKIGDDLTKSVFPLLTPFQKIGEGMFETLTRVSTGMEVAEYYIERLGSAFTDLSYTQILNPQGDVGFNALLQSIVKTDEAINGLDNNLVQIITSLDSTAEELYGTYTALDILRDTLKFLKLDTDALSFSSIRGAGSLENLSSGISAYIENFLTEEEQLAYQTTLVQKEFNKLNIAMPVSKNAFTSLIESLDLSSESGQELYGRIIVLSESFASMSDSVAKGIATLEESLVTLSANGFTKFSDSLKGLFDLAFELATSTQSTIQNLKYTQTDDSTNQLIRFNQLLKDFESSKLTTNTEATKSIYNEILSLSSTLGSDSQYNQDIINKLNTQLTGFNADKDIIRVNIVEGLGSLLGLTEQQLIQFTSSAEDGVVSNKELASINSYSANQWKELLSINTSGIKVTDSQIGTLSNISTLQNNELIKANADGIITNTELNAIKGFTSQQYNELFSINSKGIKVTDAQIATLNTLSKAQKAELVKANADGLITTTELKTITGLTQVQKEGIVEFANNSNYFSTEGTLSNLEEYSRLQLDAYRQSLAEETVGVSKKSFSYGDYIGKQEKIDIAKLTGLSGNSLDSFVQKIQALDTSKNLTKDVQSLMGYTGTSYNKTASADLDALSPYLSSDITKAIGSTKTTVSSNLAAQQAAEAKKQTFIKELAQIQAVFNIQDNEANAAQLSYYNEWKSISSEQSPATRSASYEMGIPFAVTSAPGINEKNVGAWSAHIGKIYPRYLNQFNEASAAYQILQAKLQEKALKGYSSGGYTGDGAKYDVAGYVHKGEYVLSQDNLKALGGQNSVKQIANGGLQKSLDYLAAINTKTLEKFDIMAETFKKILILTQNQTALMEASKSDLLAIRGNTAP